MEEAGRGKNKSEEYMKEEGRRVENEGHTVEEVTGCW